MSKWYVRFEDHWVTHNRSLDALYQHGYSVAAFPSEEGGSVYVLRRIQGPIILETTDIDELNRYINLILPPREPLNRS